MHQQDKPTSPSTTSTGDDSGFANFASSPSFPAFKKKIKHEASDNTGGNDAWGDVSNVGSQGFPTASTSGNGNSADVWGDSDTGDTKPSATTTSLTEIDIWGEELAASTCTNQPVQTSSSAWDDEPPKGDKGPDTQAETSNGLKPTTDNTAEVINPACIAADGWGDTAGVVTAPSNVFTGQEPSSIWGNPAMGPVQTPSTITANDAWGDSSTSQALNGTSSDTTNKDEGWGTSTSASITDNSQSYGYGNASSDGRGRGRGRGRGGRGRGGGSDRYGDDSREGSYDNGPKPHLGTGGTGNQMYQAPDSGWKARNQRAHPYATSQLSHQVSKPGNGHQDGNTSYGYTTQQGPAAAYQASMPMPPYPSASGYGTQAYVLPEAWSTNASDVNQVPRQLSNSDLLPTSYLLPQASSDGVSQYSDDNAWGGSTVDSATLKDETCNNSVWD